eukprot:3451127-Rhodomonas_salina.1
MTAKQWRDVMQQNIRPESNPEEPKPSKGWHELPEHPPGQFKEMRGYKEKMERGESGGKLVTLFSTKNQRDESIPFMNVYISTFMCDA